MEYDCKWRVIHIWKRIIKGGEIQKRKIVETETFDVDTSVNIISKRISMRGETGEERCEESF